MSLMTPLPPGGHRETRTILLVGGLIIGAFALLEALVGSGDVDVIVVRAAWAASCLALAPMAGKYRGRRLGAVALVAMAVANGYFFCVIAITGGAASPYLPWLYTLPLMMSVFTFGSTVATVLSAVGAVSFSLWLGFEDKGGRLAWNDIASAAAMVVMFWFVARFISRIRIAEAQVERARAERLEEAQRQMGAERLATIGRLAAGVAHEINNPLGYVKANMSFLSAELRDRGALADPEIAEAVADTLQGIQRIQQIVGDLRLLARDAPDSGQASRVEEVVEATLRIAGMRLARGVRVERQIAIPNLVARVDGGRLEQVLLNLLFNAADALEEKPPREGGLIVIRARAVEDRVRIEVQDNGPGISSEDRERIFDPFFTTKAPGKGTGLGLSLAREYVTRSGGRLFAEAAAGVGALFVIDLPAARAGAEVLELTPALGVKAVGS